MSNVLIAPYLPGKMAPAAPAVAGECLTAPRSSSMFSHRVSPAPQSTLSAHPCAPRCGTRGTDGTRLRVPIASLPRDGVCTGSTGTSMPGTKHSRGGHTQRWDGGGRMTCIPGRYVGYSVVDTNVEVNKKPVKGETCHHIHMTHRGMIGAANTTRIAGRSPCCGGLVTAGSVWAAWSSGSGRYRRPVAASPGHCCGLARRSNAGSSLPTWSLGRLRWTWRT